MTIDRLLGWTLVHSVWEITLVAGGLFVAGLFLKQANARYVAALAALVLCVAAPLVTALILNVQRVLPQADVMAAAVPAATASSGTDVARPYKDLRRETTVPLSVPAAATAPISLSTKIEESFPTVLRLWLIGLALMCVRLCGGLYSIERLKRTATEEAGSDWQEYAQRLAKRLGIRRSVQLLLSRRIETPSVIGFVKAVILLPASVFFHLGSAEIEAIIAHELAHVKRHDYLVNVLQTLVETILFFHPAVWWISSVVRVEREHCCDDVAIHATGDRVGYARALISLEQLRADAPQLAVAASGGSLVDRIRRIAGVRHSSRTFYPAAALATLSLVLLIASSLTRSYASTKAQADKTTVISGQVLTNDNRPAGGATVFCRYPGPLPSGFVLRPNSSLGQVVTDQGGRFQLIEKSDKSYSVTAYLRGGGSNGVIVTANKPTLTTSIRLHKPSPMAVTVVDDSGKPVAGMKLAPGMWAGPNAQGLEALQAETTDSHGVAIFPDLPGLPHLSMPFASMDPRYAVSPGRMPSAPRSVIGIEPACQVEGRVTLNGQPIANQTVSATYDVTGTGVLAGHAVDETDSSGEFRLACLPKGSSFIFCDIDEGLQAQWVATSAMVKVTPGRTAHVEINLVRGGVIQGKVVDRNGRFARNLQVDLYSPATGPVLRGPGVDSDGTFRTRVPAGTYHCVTHDRNGGPRGKEKVITVRDGETTDVVLDAPVPNVHVRVLVLGADRQPAANAHVNCYPGGFGYFDHLTNSQGIYEFDADGTRTQPYIFSAESGDQFSDLRVPQTGAQTVIQLHKVRLGSVYGVVRDPSGRALAGARVALWFENLVTYRKDGTSSGWMGDRELLPHRPITTDAGGRYFFFGIYPGRDVSIVAESPAYAGVESDVKVFGGQNQVANLTLKRPGTIDGRVVDQNGTPIVAAEVFVQDSTLRSARTDGTGRFHFSRAPVGSHKIDIYKGYNETRLRGETGTNKTYFLRLKPNAKSKLRGAN